MFPVEQQLERIDVPARDGVAAQAHIDARQLEPAARQQARQQTAARIQPGNKSTGARKQRM